MVASSIRLRRMPPVKSPRVKHPAIFRRVSTRRQVPVGAQRIRWVIAARRSQARSLPGLCRIDGQVQFVTARQYETGHPGLGVLVELREWLKSIRTFSTASWSTGSQTTACASAVWDRQFSGNALADPSMLPSNCRTDSQQAARCPASRRSRTGSR